VNGYIKDWRQELESDVWLMPPLYHRVWQYLKYMANHKDKLVPMRDGTKKLIRRGQHLTSMRRIAEGVGWYEHGVFKTPDPKTISRILQWLQQNGMIELEYHSNSTMITIVNYCIYQSQDDDKCHSNSTVSPQSLETNNNDKNDKNDKNNINIMSMDLVHEVQKEVHEEAEIDQKDISACNDTVHGREFEVVPSSKVDVAPLSDKPTPKDEKAKLAAEFAEWWQDYPRKDARKEAEAEYIATRRKGATKEELEKAKRNYIRYIHSQGTEKHFIMLGKTFLGPNERWRDWLNDIEVAALVMGSGMSPVSSQAAREQEKKELAMFGGDYKKWWAWKKKQLRQ